MFPLSREIRNDPNANKTTDCLATKSAPRFPSNVRNVWCALAMIASAGAVFAETPEQPAMYLAQTLPAGNCETPPTTCVCWLRVLESRFYGPADLSLSVNSRTQFWALHQQTSRRSKATCRLWISAASKPMRLVILGQLAT